MVYPRIRQLRKAHALTQQQIATLIGIPQSTYAGYETGRARYVCATLLKLAAFYHTSVDYILGRTDQKTPRKP